MMSEGGGPLLHEEGARRYARIVPSLRGRGIMKRASPAWAPKYERPDITNFTYGRGGAHQLLDIKVYSSLSAVGQPVYPADRLLWSSSRRAQRKVDLDYAEAARRSHTIVPLVHSAFGALAPDAVSLLRTLDREVKSQLPDPKNAPPLVRTFFKLHAQSLTTAVQLELARQVLYAARNASAGAA